MAVILFLASGDQRVLDEADGAHMDGPFFVITRWDSRLQRTQTVVTMRSQDVVSAEIQKDDGTTEFVLGAAGLPRKE